MRALEAFSLLSGNLDEDIELNLCIRYYYILLSGDAYSIGAVTACDGHFRKAEGVQGSVARCVDLELLVGTQSSFGAA